ncbi:SWIM zinc finger family protein [Sorangium sp. So ce513]|uniref:SWIM zinc finger family protein n=1 Tax=Sorangium sp. So ce513 TaxID=3133315 RepID=UPI003F5ED3DC
MTAALARPIHLRYAAPSELAAAPLHSSVRLSLDSARGPVGVRGTLRDAALFRDAMAALATILESDLRYKGRDRTAYLAYLMKQGKKATAAIWEAQKAFLESAFGDDAAGAGQVDGSSSPAKAASALDPVLTVHPDEVSIEVFSRDESAYARLALSSELFEGREAAHGTAFVDLSPRIVEQIDRLRVYAKVELDAGASRAAGATGHGAGGAGGARGASFERSLEVPTTWLRGFLQVQSAAALPAVSCELAPIDLYNALYVLRTRKAKKPPRGLRFELVPGKRPRLILEPWEILLEGHGPPYEGPPRVVRTYGRQRLLALSRLLPHVRSARAELRGPGLPVFWVLDLGRATLTVALTGWTDRSWASAASFDALMPRDGAARAAIDALAARQLALLRERGPLPLADLSAGAGAEDARAALQLECLRGRVLYDVARRVYRPRELFAEPVDEREIRYSSPREAAAHRLLGAAGAVKTTKVHEIAGEGTEIHGQVADREAHRDFSPRFTVDLEGRVSDAWCSCPTFRRSGLREGPCEHMIALRVAHARERAAQDALRQTAEGRALVRAETRTYVRREASGAEVVYRVSLDDRVVHLSWGARAEAPRHQRIWFDTDVEARDAYFKRLDALTSSGFVDADAASA